MNDVKKTNNDVAFEKTAKNNKNTGYVHQIFQGSSRYKKRVESNSCDYKVEKLNLTSENNVKYAFYAKRRHFSGNVNDPRDMQN